MKKLVLILSLGLLFGNLLNAQTPLTNAVNFTATDIYGVEHTLFDYLDDGKFVCIDFFFIACQTCVATVPNYNAAYQHYGCNSSNVIFLAVSSSDNQSALLNYAASTGYEFPMIPNNFGISNSYGITYHPTYILIAPNRVIVERDIWPASNIQAFTTPISNQGGIPAECGTPVSLDFESILNFEVYPNPVQDILHIAVDEPNLKVELYNVFGSMIDSFILNDRTSYNFSNKTSGMYFLHAIRTDGSNKVFKIIKE